MSTSQDANGLANGLAVVAGKEALRLRDIVMLRLKVKRERRYSTQSVLPVYGVGVEEESRVASIRMAGRGRGNAIGQSRGFAWITRKSRCGSGSR